MRIHKYSGATLTTLPARKFCAAILFVALGALVFNLAACKRNSAFEAIDSDANGYVCLKCGAKFYTERTAFMGANCPQCKADALQEAVGYYCEKDKHLTIRAREGDRQGAVCEKCQAPLINAMKAPQEKDLKAWGATKVKG
jgi:ribosomal protein L40E